MQLYGRLFLIVAISWGFMPFTSSNVIGASYHGKVVEAETGKPIEGAVVVVVWHKKPIITMDGPQYVHKTAEVLTNLEGVFSIDASPGIDWNPLTYVLNNPSIAIFKPGYGPFPTGHVKELSIEATKKKLIEGGAVIKLPRLTTKEQLRNFTDTGDMWISAIVPYARIPILTKLINIQRQSVGLQPVGQNRD